MQSLLVEEIKDSTQLNKLVEFDFKFFEQGYLVRHVFLLDLGSRHQFAEGLINSLDFLTSSTHSHQVQSEYGRHLSLSLASICLSKQTHG